MIRGDLVTQSQTVADLSPENSLDLVRNPLPYKEIVWLNILDEFESEELHKLKKWYLKYFPEIDESKEPKLIVPPKQKSKPRDILEDEETEVPKESPGMQESRKLIEIINHARRIRCMAARAGKDGGVGDIYFVRNHVRELQNLMYGVRRDPRDREITYSRTTSAGLIYDWACDIEEEFSRQFIILKNKDGVGIRGNLTEISDWGLAGVLGVDGLDRYPMFMDTVGNGEQSDSMYLGILMHYLPKVIYEYLESSLNQQKLVDPRPNKLNTFEDLRLNDVFLTETALLEKKHTGEYGWQPTMPAPLDGVTKEDVEYFYRNDDLSAEELSMRIGLINFCVYALSATIVGEIDSNVTDDAEKYRKMMEIRNIISRNFGYILAAIENILYFFENEIGFENVKKLDADFESKTTLYMRFVSPYKYSVMNEIDSTLKRFGLRFSTRVGFRMRTDMIVRGEKTVIYDFKSTIHYDGSFESKTKAIGYVLAEILKKIWGGTFSSDADSFVISKITFNQNTIRDILAELGNYEFYFWGMNGDKVRVEISPEDIIQFLKLTKLYTQCKISSKTKSSEEEKDNLMELWLPDESHNASVTSDSVEQ
jgi:hypothetical protein